MVVWDFDFRTSEHGERVAYRYEVRSVEGVSKVWYMCDTGIRDRHGYRHMWHIGAHWGCMELMKSGGVLAGHWRKVQCRMCWKCSKWWT